MVDHTMEFLTQWVIRSWGHWAVCLSWAILIIDITMMTPTIIIISLPMSTHNGVGMVHILLTSTIISFTTAGLSVQGVETCGSVVKNVNVVAGSAKGHTHTHTHTLVPTDECPKWNLLLILLSTHYWLFILISLLLGYCHVHILLFTYWLVVAIIVIIRGWSSGHTSSSLVHRMNACT